MTSEVRVNTLKARSGLGTVSFNDSGVVVSGIVTANSFVGDGSNLTNIPKIVVETAQSVSGLGTAVPFTSIPSWVKRITVLLTGVSTSGTSDVIVQIGTSSGYVSSGYIGTAITLVGGASPGSSAYSSGFLIRLGGAATATAVRHGRITLHTVGNNIWIGDVMIGLSDVIYAVVGAGSLTLAGALDRIRLTTVNGTDTFDAGLVNIMYE